MRRAFDGVVRGSIVAGCAVLLAACGPGEEDLSPAAAVATTTAAEVAPTTTSPVPVTTTAAPTPQAVQVPALVGTGVAEAQAALKALGLRWRTMTARTARYAAGTVIAQSHGSERRLNPGSVVTLTIAVPPPPKPSPKPAPPPSPTPAPDPQPSCHPSYAGACLDPEASDYDCAGGSGNGPKYTGRVQVVGPDVFDLDRDGDGVGCESD